MPKKSDKLNSGDEYQPLTLNITSDLNQQFTKALDCTNSRYENYVHPSIFFSFCSITQSPSFVLDKNVNAVAAKFENEFIKTAKLERKYTIYWKVADVYEKRSRLYQICDVTVLDQDGDEVVKRKINNTFVGGEYLEKRVRWEKETGYRRALQINEFPAQGYEIVSGIKKISMQKLRWFSGGVPGSGWPARNIHTDREISIRSGIGRAVASGFMIEGYLNELIVDFIGEEWLNFGRTKMIAIDMVGDGDEITAKAVLKNNGVRTKLGEINFEIWGENQYGNRIVIGSANSKLQ